MKTENRPQQELRDDENPRYLFSTTWTSLLLQIAKGEIDAQNIAKQELAARGMGDNGEWVGFDATKKIWKLIKN